MSDLLFAGALRSIRLIRVMSIDQDMRRYYAIGDRADLTYEEKLREYRTIVDEHFEVERYHAFCESALPSLRDDTVDWFAGADFDALLVDSVRETFPAHEHDEMVERHRSLLGAWVRDQQKAGLV